MKFSDFVLKGAIVSNLKATKKNEVIAELVGALANPAQNQAENSSEINLAAEDLEPALDPADVDAVVAAIVKREELGTTGVGRGYAVPHTIHPAVKRLACAIGVSEEGVDFDSLDRQKVKLLFLFVCPDEPAAKADRLEALKYTVTNLRDEGFARFLQQSQTVADVVASLDEQDSL